jgi:hypothetical protein
MTISIAGFTDEFAALAYLQARNSPRDTIRYGVRPNAIKALSEYAYLLTALNGGDTETGVPDMSAILGYHVNAVAAVSPFVDLMQAAMRILIDTPALINQLALMQGQTVPPMGAEITDVINPAEYATLLQSTADAIQAVGQLMQGGGE